VAFGRAVPEGAPPVAAGSSASPRLTPMSRTFHHEIESAGRAPRRAALPKLALASAALLLLGTGCQSAARDIDNHWNFASVPPRIARNVLGYDAARDGAYRDFQWERKKDINLTLRRLFLNDNPENPFQEYDPTLYEGRPVHSILPNPIRYIHLEGILLGWAITGAGGGFFPIPVDSLIGTFDAGGGEEFSRGISATLTGKGVLTASETPSMYAADLQTGEVATISRM